MGFASRSVWWCHPCAAPCTHRLLSFGRQSRSRHPPAGHGATRTGRRGDRSLARALPGVQDRPATDTGSTRLRGAPGDRIAADPSSLQRTPPAPACVPVVSRPDPGIPARRETSGVLGQVTGVLISIVDLHPFIGQSRVWERTGQTVGRLRRRRG